MYQTIRSPLTRMPQQINLFSSVKSTPKSSFSAQCMLRALTVFVLLGGGLSAYWVWSLQSAGEDLKKFLATQSLELESMKVAVAKSKVGGGQVGSALTQELQGLRTELLQREKLAQEWQRGLLRPGWGHAAKLLLIAQSIPAQVWVTEVIADEKQFQVDGFTLDPTALNDWVGKLATSPLLKGQALSTVKIDRVVAPPAPASAASAEQRPMWSFNLVSAVGKPSAAAGPKP